MSSELVEEYASILFAMRHRSVRSVEEYADEYRRRFDPNSVAPNSESYYYGHGGAASTDIQHLNEVKIQPIKELKMRDDILAAISVERQRQRKKMTEGGGALCTFQPELSPKAQQHQHANKVWHERLHTDDVMKRELHAAERSHQRAIERQQADEDEVREMSRGPAAHATTNTFNRLYLSGKQHDKWVEREQQLQADLLARELQKGQQRSPYRNGSSERQMRRQGSVFDNLYKEARQRQEQQQSEHDVATRHVDTPNRSVDLRRKNTVSPSRMAESAIHQRLYEEATERTQNLVQAQEEQRAKSLEGLFQPNLSKKESVLRDTSLTREHSMRSNSFARREVVEVVPVLERKKAPPVLETHLDQEVKFVVEEPIAAPPSSHQSLPRDPSPVTVSPPRERQTLSPVIIASVSTLDVVASPSIARSLSSSGHNRDLSNTRTPATIDMRDVVNHNAAVATPSSSSIQAPRTVPQPNRDVSQSAVTHAAPERSPTVAATSAAAPSLAAVGVATKKSRSERTPEEQAAHDQRKKERHARKESERRSADAAASLTPPAKATKTPPQRNLTPPPQPAGSASTAASHRKERASPSLNAGTRTPPPPVEKEDVFGAVVDPSHHEPERFVRQSIDLSGIASSTTPKPIAATTSDANSGTPEHQSPNTSALDTSSAGRTAESPSRAALALNRKQSRRLILEKIAILDSDDDSS
ncbi:Hypothetical protein, putative [Bodo saltans]|uniref:Uncharacterized protein n=1 Tax=Bodo saltans TaxID=75058 RepID=A0A0S4KIM9_BODSA|nr:Hypothetical protein, putative [Bodo saltans]|eukprot:CUI15554.1 Hypothetical protein, putative [Bodo saltans]